MPLPPTYLWDLRLNALRKTPGGRNLIPAAERRMLVDSIAEWNLMSVEFWTKWERSAEKLIRSANFHKVTQHNDAVRGTIKKDGMPFLWLPNVAQLLKSYGAAATFRHSIGALRFMTPSENEEALRLIAAVFCSLNPYMANILNHLQNLVEDVPEAAHLISFFNYMRNNLILALDFGDPEIIAKMDRTGRVPTNEFAHIYMTEEQTDLYFSKKHIPNMALVAIDRFFERINLFW